eukprot:CAMPEP_0170785998 /NCGR_PEP_ID=MMETSP0733-20121128/17306_1 /TAXON_ID=186038 /ORGANISM="Fragilariopsis kerguelensis, Strain L26-C5" /LENGTH=97 /DNA_ID=CAMNT_0011131691 /DNA_START=1 /DNA_END=290 /DNA_ORIENTATION=+
MKFAPGCTFAAVLSCLLAQTAEFGVYGSTTTVSAIATATDKKKNNISNNISNSNKGDDKSRKLDGHEGGGYYQQPEPYHDPYPQPERAYHDPYAYQP